MHSKVFRIKFFYYLPMVFALLRVALSVVTLAINPMHLPLAWFQLVPTVVVLGSLFCYCRLYRDGVPVISLLAPTIVHCLLILAFLKKFVVVPFIPLLVCDLTYILLKAYKASALPFEVEDDAQTKDNFDDLEVV